MSSLYLRYRPTSLDGIHGNHACVSALRTYLAKPMKERARALLFTGPSGCGKTTMARIVAGASKCDPLDFMELDSADFRGIDTIRDIRRSMYMTPMNGDFKVYILDEVHQLSKDAQSALLKALEDTPKHVLFLLATTDPDKLLPTIRNRCMTFLMEPLDEKEMSDLLTHVCKMEKKKVPESALQNIVDSSLGSARAALVILDKVIDLDKDSIEEAVEEAAAQEQQAIDLCRALMKNAPWRKIADLLSTIKEEPESIRRLIMGYFSAVLIREGSARVYFIMDHFREPFYDCPKARLTMACFGATTEK